MIQDIFIQIYQDRDWGEVLLTILTQTGFLLFRMGTVLFLAWLTMKTVKVLLPKLFVNERVDPRQGRTLISLLLSLVRYAVYFIAGVTILVIFDIPVTPILTSAGIVGVAVGFGAQNLVRDVIAGFFILFEGQFHVGDFIQINGEVTGTVEEIGLRITKVREWSQRLHFVANGEVKRVTNYNRQRMRPIISVTVPYRYSTQRITPILEQVCAQVAEKYADHLIQDPTVFGVTDIVEKGITYTLIALSIPESYWFIERVLRKEILDQFHKEGIEIAYPHRVVLGSEGVTPPGGSLNQT
jgi:small conductance mechanosensitive channel